MAVTSATYKISYDGRGDTGPYAITFPVQLDAGGDAKDIKVYAVVKATGVSTDITSTSTISGLNVTTADSWSALYDIILVRDPALTQPYSLPYRTKLPHKTIEEALDRLLFIAQKLSLQAGLSLRFPLADDAITDLPTVEAMKGKLLGLDAEGVPAAYAGVPSAPVTAAAATILDDATISDILTTLGLSAFIKTLIDDASAAAARATLAAAQAYQAGVTVFEAEDTTNRDQTPTKDVWYNLGSLSLTLQAGTYLIEYEVNPYATHTAGGLVGMDLLTTLSKAADSQDDAGFTATMYLKNPSELMTTLRGQFRRSKIVTIASETTYYLNTMTSVTVDANTKIGNANALSRAFIRAHKL